MAYPEPILANIASLENLYMAWNRLAKSITYSDVWYDEYEFSKFECLLDQNIHNVHKSLLDGSYRMDSIRPIPFPKGGRDDKGNLKVRQAFWISMKDQLVWVAICNILGPLIETKMPGWSTGNRLYVPMWKDNGDEDTPWQYGSFLNSYPFIYRKWKQGWPKYRKVLTASIKRMAIGKCDKKNCQDILDDTDETEITENTGMPGWLNVRYLTDNYFKGKKFRPKLYWGGIDLKTFYPTIKTPILMNDLIRFASVKEEATMRLIHSMLEFEVDKSGYSEQELADMGFEKDKSIGLPTGLIVGGWLSNVYLLDIDKAVEEKLKNNKSIIHFRYVDDHTFVAETFEALVDWMHEYWLVLKERNLKINFDKIQPTLSEPYSKVFSKLIEDGWECLDNEEIKKVLAGIKPHGKEDVIKAIGACCAIDPIYPSPLMTLTLQKVSQISNLSLNLLSKNENDLVFHDLKSLITVDLPDAEIKKETRISFASTMLSRMLLSNTIDLDKIRDLRESFIKSCYAEKKAIQLEREYFKSSTLSEEEKNARSVELDKKINDVNNCLKYAFDELHYDLDKNLIEGRPSIKWSDLGEIRNCVRSSREKSDRRANKIFYLLRRALNEAPDKVNIWIRTMEFCIRHTPKHIPELFSHLENISDKSLHRLGVVFIRRQLVSLCTTRFIKTVWKYLDYKKEKREHDEKEKLFIDQYLQLPELDGSYYFNYGTARFLNLAKSFFNLIDNGDVAGVETYMKDDKCSDTAFSLIYLINLAENNVSPTVIANALLSMVNYVGQDDTYLEPLLIKLIDVCREATDDDQKSLTECINTSSIELAKSVCAHTFKSYSDSADEEEWISIRDLLRSNKWQVGEFGKSEYVCVKIMSDILCYITENGDIIKKLSSSYFNTSNLFLRNEEIKAYDWHDQISDRKKFLVLYNPDKEDILLKALNKAPVMEPAEYESRIIYGLGTVFYQLLCGRHDDEWQKLYRETGYSWRSKINILNDSGRICTASKRILCGCLLPYVWESKRINGTVSSRNNAIAIKNLMDLKNRMDELKAKLRRNIILKSIDTKGLIDSDGTEDLDKVAYRVVEFKVIEVD